jgi:pyroglutamyl-peptidase
MRQVLLTSFEPFGGQRTNSSLEVGRCLMRQTLPGVHLDWVVLPVVAGQCVEAVWARIVTTRPTLVLSLGQAAGAANLRIEERAVNRNHFCIPDNAGNLLQNQAIVPSGPPAYRSTLETGRLLRSVRGAGIAAEVSGSAGTYVCNHLFYSLLHRAAVAGLRHPTGFLHLPLLPAQINPRRPLPSRPLEHLTKGVGQCIRACLGLNPAAPGLLPPRSAQSSDG